MIAIRGSGFGDGATVTFDGVPATDVIVVDQTEITCTPPAHADGFVTVVVTNLDGTSGELADTFVYTTPTVDPDEGPKGGGILLTLTISDGGAGVPWFPAGHDLAVYVNNRFRALGVDLADPDLNLNPASESGLPYTRLSDNQLTCTTADEPCGPTDVFVVDLDLVGMGEPNILFYLPFGYRNLLDPPTLTDILPTSGAARGGTHVVLTGSFSCVTCDGGGDVRVDLGGVPLTTVGCTVDAISGITGLHAAGVVDVVVTNPDGQTVTLPAAYTYVAAPTVTAIDPDHGPDVGGTPVTITGTGFVDGATVAMRGLDPDGLPTIADCTAVVFISETTLTAVTSAHPAAVVDVVVTNPDDQHGMLEHGYDYEGWWLFDGDDFSFDDFDWPLPIDPFSFRWYVYRARIPGLHWETELALPPPVDGWWVSLADYGGNVMVVASSRPKDPRRWNQIADFATGPAGMLGGSPGIAVAFHNRMVYASSDYVVGTTFPSLRIYDGSFDRELCRLPPTVTNAKPIAVMSMLAANGTIYLSTLDSGSSSADWSGRVFSLDLNTAALTPIGAPFPTGHVPYALAWHNGQLWCGTHRQTTDATGKLFRIRPDGDAPAWVEDATLPTGFSCASLYSWRGTLYAGTTAPAGTFAQVRALGESGTWATVDTGSGGAATHNNGYLAFSAFTDADGEDALYASYWNQDAPVIGKIRRTVDGTTWTSDFTGSEEDGTARPFIVLTVDNGILFAIGGGGNFTAAIVVREDGVWSDRTNQLPDDDKTALPAVAVLVF